MRTTHHESLAMLNLQSILIERFLQEIEATYMKNYGMTDPLYGAIAAWGGRLALELIANSDALYHNVEHTIMVTSVGQTLLLGKHMTDGGVTPRDWLHFMLALLFHDIGYTRDICRSDNGSQIATGTNTGTLVLPFGATDAALEPYHVDRSKLFVRERFGAQLIQDIDGEQIASYIEMTRFPKPHIVAEYDDSSYHSLVRAADVIGQLGDSGYLRKIPALYYEFEAVGKNAELGYTSPGDMYVNYAKFFWENVQPRIGTALRYLRATQAGKQWIANLHAHVFAIEHADSIPTSSAGRGTLSLPPTTAPPPDT